MTYKFYNLIGDMSIKRGERTFEMSASKLTANKIEDII